MKTPCVLASCSYRHLPFPRQVLYQHTLRLYLAEKVPPVCMFHWELPRLLSHLGESSVTWSGFQGAQGTQTVQNPIPLATGLVQGKGHHLSQAKQTLSKDLCYSDHWRKARVSGGHLYHQLGTLARTVSHQQGSCGTQRLQLEAKPTLALQEVSK